MLRMVMTWCLMAEGNELLDVEEERQWARAAV